MITLKNLLEEQRVTGMSDIQIIETFFIENDIEESGLEMIHNLTKTKIEKLKTNQKMVKEWVSNLPSKYLYEDYDLETAHQLHTLELDFLSNGGELSERRLKWAEKNIPDMPRPLLYFNPLIEWLAEKGIAFKSRQGE